MANICINDVCVSGPESKVKEFKKKYFVLDGKGKEQFAVGELEEHGPHPRWMLTTAFDIRSKDEGQSELLFVIDTPWSPPRDLLIDISEKMPGLTISVKYDEPSLEEPGLFEVVDGKVMKDC